MSRRLIAMCLVIILLGVVSGACVGRSAVGNTLAKWMPSFGWLQRDGGTLPGGSDQETGGNPKDPATEEPEEPQETSGEKTTVTKDTYVIDVDVAAQLVKVMKGDEVVKDMICSTGIEGKETPLGEFRIQNRGTWFYNDKYKQGAKYWVSFKDWGIYLFHSVAMDANKEIIPEEEAKLGTPASHGCVRLAVDDAKWIYDNIPAETKVIIHE